jgi:outer membrane immunogenic protein
LQNYNTSQINWVFSYRPFKVSQFPAKTLGRKTGDAIMRRRAVFLFVAVALSLGAVGTAFSADLGRPVYKAPPPAPPPPPPVRNWTGFYVGGYVGGAFPSQDVTVSDNFGISSWSYGLDSSFIGGGTLGYNYQSPYLPLLVGIELEGGYLSLKGSASNPVFPDVVSSARIGNWDFMATGRVGWLPTPDWLLYLKGGAVWTELKADVTGHFVNASGSDTFTGWTLGGGVEWMFFPQWSVKAEYLFLGINELEHLNTPATVVACDGALCFNHDFPHGVHTVKAGLNYHF